MPTIPPGMSPVSSRRASLARHAWSRFACRWVWGAIGALSVSVLPGCGWFSVGVSEAQVQAALEGKMPLTVHHVAITSPRVTLNGEKGKVQVCAQWELISESLPGRLRPGGDVCAQTALRWDKGACEVRLDQPSLTKAGLAGAVSLPGPRLSRLTKALSRGLHDMPVYQAGWLPCQLVSSIGVGSGKIEIRI